MINNLIYGFIVGFGSIMPLLSGTVFMINLGIYDKCLKYIMSINCLTKKDIIEIILLSTGFITSIYIFSNFINYIILVNKEFLSALLIFISVITVIYLYLKIKKERVLSLCIITISFLVFIIFSIFLGINITINHNIFTLILAGLLYSMGKLIPCVSSSIFLLMFNLYDLFISIISDPFSYNIYFYISLIPFFIGTLIGIIIFPRITSLLYFKYYKFFINIIISFYLYNTIFYIFQFVFSKL